MTGSHWFPTGSRNHWIRLVPRFPPLQGTGTGTIRAGMLVLIATPIVRVMIIVGRCVVVRDWPFLGISASVLGLLGVGIWLGL